MENPRLAWPGTEVKIFDPRDASTGLGGAELTDASVVQRNGQWWMYLAGQAAGYGPPDLYSASLAKGALLSAMGWKLTRGSAGELVPVAGRTFSGAWDGKGGRHSPSFVKGWEPRRSKWVERIYYAGAAENVGGPYTIGFLEWDGDKWIDQAEPAFSANEEWEHGSVFEPNLLYHDGKWKMWYVAGSIRQDYLVHGYVESEDGHTGWSKHALFAPPEMRMFDFCVRERGDAFDAIFSRVWLFKEVTPPPETGLWWCRAGKPSRELSDWSQPIQIMTAEDRGWHSGPFKPSFQFQGQTEEHALVFFDGLCRTSDPGPFPFALTLGCLEVDLPRGIASGSRPAA
jgi:hypothetical protein